jgi:hypothetical protein
MSGTNNPQRPDLVDAGIRRVKLQKQVITSHLSVEEAVEVGSDP